MMEIEDYFSGDVKNALLETKSKCDIEEIRLRIEKPVLIKAAMQICYLKDKKDKKIIFTKAECENLIDRISGYSLYAYSEEVKNGFITVQGGHRIGICGQFVVKNGEIINIKNISSLNFRIANQHIGMADELCKRLYLEKNNLFNILILSPPGCGKTSLLRDMIRIISNKLISVSVIDERGEIAACYQGIPQNDVGVCTDIFDLAPKNKGVLIALKSMSPDLIALDEINDKNDFDSLLYSTASGAKIICTAHSDEGLIKKEYLSRSIFERFITLNYSREYRVYDETGSFMFGGVLCRN